MNWHFDEVMMVERMREAQRKADRAQAVGLVRHGRCEAWERIRITLGRALVGLGTRLQQAEPLGSPDLAPSSQCDLR